MLNSVPWYFEVLPYHPQPRPFESFSGYLIRIFEGNGISDFPSVRILTGIPMHYSHAIVECPLPSSLGLLSKLTSCSETSLLSTSFYHLFRKFDVAIEAGKPGRRGRRGAFDFLAGSVSEYLRLCPLCFSEDEYYSLIPRFVHLEGCSKHQCQFIEKCPSCEIPLSLLCKNLVLGYCNNCGFDLRESSPIWLEDTFNMERLKSHQKTIEFLLSPHPEENYGDLLRRRLASNFLWLRELRGFTVPEICQNIHTTRAHIRFMEYVYDTTSMRKKRRLTNYISYSEVLETNIEDLLTHEFLPSSIDVNNLDRWIRIEVRQLIVMMKVKKVINSMLENDEEITQKRVAELLDVEDYFFYSYHEVRKYINDERVKQIDNHRKKHIQNIINLFESVDDPDSLGSMERIFEILNINYAVWSKDWALSSLYRELNSNYQKFLRREAKLLAEVMIKIDSSVKASHPSIAEIVRILDYKPSYLGKYPKVLKYIYSFCKNGEKFLKFHLEKETYWVGKILEILRHATNNNIEANRNYVTEKMGKSIDSFYRFSRTRELLQELPTVKQIRNMKKDKAMREVLQSLLEDCRKRESILSIATVEETLNQRYFKGYKSTDTLLEEIRNYNESLANKEDLRYLALIKRLAEDAEQRFFSVEELLAKAGLNRQILRNCPETYAYILNFSEQNRWLYSRK